MISYKIDDSLIYEILKVIDNAPNMTTTLREIVDNTSLTDYDAGNTAISEMSKMGLLAGYAHDGIITVSFDSRGCGKLFLDNYKHVSRLTSRQKWVERFWGYAFGVLTGITIAVAASYLGLS